VKRVSVTKIVQFEAGHKLWNDHLTEKQNQEIYGACYRDKDCVGHGHTYTLEVTVIGPVDENGFVINFKDLKSIIQEEIVSECDHRFLNQELPYITTCENMVQDFWKRIWVRLPDAVNLKKVRLWETANSYATIEDLSV